MLRFFSGSKCLSLKRRREFSEERKGKSKRPCQVEIIPISISSDSSSNSSDISSQPKYVRSVLLKTSRDSVLTINEKSSPNQNIHGEQTKTLNNIRKELFKDASREPKTESEGLKTAALSCKVLEPSLLKEEMEKSSESKSSGVSTHLTNPCSSIYNHSHSDGSSPSFSQSSSFSSLMNTSPAESSKRIQSSSAGSNGSTKSDTEEGKLEINDPKSTPNARHDEKKKCLVWKDPLDLESDEGAYFNDDTLSLSSSASSEEEQLLSLKEILKRSRVPDTPDKTAFSEPSTPLNKASVSTFYFMALFVLFSYFPV